MSTPILSNWDFSHLELLNIRFQNLAADPSSPSKGWTYFNTVSNRPRWYDGTVWVELGSGGGSVTSVSVVSANGFAGSVATSTTTPAITVTTTITGVLKGNGTAISAGVSGTDYSAGTNALATGILKSTTTTGALTIAIAADFPTLNQSTTGSAGSFTGSLVGDVTGTQGATALASTSNVNTIIRANRLDQMAVPTATVSFNSQVISNVATPVAATDAANKGYTDAIAQGVVTKPSAKYTTTTALAANTYNNGTSGVGATLTANANGIIANIDGQTPVNGDIVLVRNEAAPANNGLYVVTAIGTGGTPYILTRQVNMDTTAEFAGGLVAIETGTLGAGQLWLVSNTAPVTVGTTAITFIQLNGATSLIATAPLNIAGNTISVNTNGITSALLRQGAALSVIGVTGNATANEADIAGTAAQVLRVNTGGTALAFGTVDTAGITAAAVTYAKLQNETTLTLLGNPTGGAAAPSEITLSADLAFASTVLGIAAATTLTRKSTGNIGDGTTTAWVYTHGLNSRAVVVDISSATTPWGEVMCDVAKTSVNTITLTFVVAPTTNQFTVTVIG